MPKQGPLQPIRAIALFFSLALPILGRAQTICVDPGHPSEVGVGTRGKHISELHAAWLVSLKLVELLKKDGYKVVVTKQSEGELVTNRRRAEIANAAHADFMIRLHCDAGSKSGFASYYPGAQGRKGRDKGPSLNVIRESSVLAGRFHPAVIASLAGILSDRGLHTEDATFIGAKQGALTGSIYAKVPVVLVEMAVLQNQHDDLLIATSKGQREIAFAIEQGIKAAVPRAPSSIH